MNLYGSIVILIVLLVSPIAPTGRNKAELCKGKLTTTNAKALYIAAGRSKTGVEQLLSNCTDPNAKVKLPDKGPFAYKYTLYPIILAVERNNTEIFKKLIEYGADINVSDFDGFPIHYAVRRKNIEMLRLILNQGAYVHVTDAREKSALAYAKELQREDMVSLLSKAKEKPIENGQDCIKLANEFYNQITDYSWLPISN